MPCNYNNRCDNNILCIKMTADPHWTSTLGLLSGLVGAITGMIALARNVLINRVIVKVSSDYIFEQTDSGFLLLEISNLSASPITIRRIEVRSSKSKIFEHSPDCNVLLHQLPKRLESRTSFTLKCPHNIHLGADKDEYKDIKVLTACGASVTVSNKKIANLVDPNGEKKKARNEIRKALNNTPK